MSVTTRKASRGTPSHLAQGIAKKSWSAAEYHRLHHLLLHSASVLEARNEKSQPQSLGSPVSWPGF